MKRVEVDDQITAVFQSMTLCLTVEKVEREVFYCTTGDGLADAGTAISHCLEGIFWIHGWYTPDSEEVKAARVAQGIGDQKRQTKPTYKELELVAQQAKAEASEARKLLDRMQQKADQRTPAWSTDPPIHPHGNESYSDAAWRKLRRGGY